MNKKHIISAVTASTIGLASATHAADLSTDAQKFSYGIGMNVGSSLARENLDLDQDALVEGLKDILNGNEAKVSAEELQRVFAAVQEKQAQAQASAAEDNKKAGEAFLAENKTKDGITVTDSGLQYRVITEGKGDKPTASDTVTVHYRGKLINGTEFDSSYARGEPATFPVGGVVQGWQEALPMMNVGSKWEVFIPSDLGYGPRGAGGSIGPNETLIFEIELIEIQK